jgi:predicted RNase H-like HicB family nuclease
MSRPNYRVLLSFDSERKVFTARVPELPPCTGEGATRTEALLNMERELDALVQNLADSGGRPPAAVDDLPVSEQLAVKVSRSLQRDLAFQAHIEGIELGQLCAEILAGGLSHRQHSARPVRRSAASESPGNEAAPRRFDRQDRGGPDPRGEPAGRWRPSGNSGGRNNPGRNQGLLEDRAQFIEYVRAQEQDSSHGPSGGRGGRPGFDNRGGGRRGPPSPGGGGGGPRPDRPQRPTGGGGANRGGDGQGGSSGSAPPA